MILNILFASDYVQRVFGFDSSDPELKTVTLFLWILMGFAGMLLYLYVGTRAVREGRTGERRRGYLVVAAVLLVVNVLLFISNLMAFSESQMDPLDLMGELLQEFACAANFGAMLHAARQTRKLSLNREKEAVGCAD